MRRSPERVGKMRSLIAAGVALGSLLSLSGGIAEAAPRPAASAPNVAPEPEDARTFKIDVLMPLAHDKKDPNRTRLSPKAKAQIAGVTTYVACREDAGRPGLLTFQGHASAEGDPTFNRWLSNARRTTVRQAFAISLLDRGAHETRLDSLPPRPQTWKELGSSVKWAADKQDITPAALIDGHLSGKKPSDAVHSSLEASRGVTVTLTDPHGPTSYYGTVCWRQAEEATKASLEASGVPESNYLYGLRRNLLPGLMIEQTN